MYEDENNLYHYSYRKELLKEIGILLYHKSI